METKKAQKHNFNCVVNLRRMTEREHTMYSNSSVIVSKQLDIKIKGNCLEIEGKKQYSTSNTFTISFKKRLNEFLLENLSETPAPASVHAINSKSKFSPTATTKLRAVSAKTLNSIISDTWKLCKKNFSGLNEPANIGDIVMAKLKTFSAWPGRVQGFTKDKKRAQIYFFGTDNTGSVNVNEIVAFAQSESVIRLLLLRMTGPFHKGILEVESILGVTHEFSLLRERNALE